MSCTNAASTRAAARSMLLVMGIVGLGAAPVFAQGRSPQAHLSVVVEIGDVPLRGVTEVTGLSSSTDTVDYRSGSEPDKVIKIPGVHRLGDVTLKRGVVADSRLWDWRQTVIAGSPDRRPVTIAFVRPDGSPVVRYRLVNAWPSKWEGPSLHADSSGDVAVETVVLSPEGIELLE